MGHDVFISHSSQSSTAATSIVQQLEQNGIHCWIAPRDLNPGSEWAEGIIDGIEECPVFLLLLCPHANSSPQVLREVERAVSKKKPVIPVMLGNFTLSKSLEYFISSHHWLEFSPKTARNNTKILIDVIHKKLSNQDRVAYSSSQEAPLNTHSRQTFFSRKRAVFSLLALLFLLLSWLFFHFFWHHFASPAPPPAVPKTTTQALDHSTQATISEEDLGPDVVSGEVFGIPNGNVVKARINGKERELRLYGIDAPAPQQEYNEEARAFLEQLIIDNRIRATLLGKDDRGHTEAIVSSGEALLNKEMIRAGYAWKNPKHCQKEPLCSEMGKLEQKARDQRLGLWQGDNPIPPWEWPRHQKLLQKQ
ncbi:MAG: TIR domain-containing protein [Candidatus Electrothrix scaldis]|nr:MAG: TIR domain-containing protein [Candidatus Electrothrix sp. GW3-3]